MIAGFAIPERLPEPAERLLRAVEWRHRLARNPPAHWFTALADPSNEGPVRAEIPAIAAAALGGVQAAVWARSLEPRRA